MALRIRAMHEANTALLDIFVDNSIITSWITGQNVQKLQILLFFAIEDAESILCDQEEI